MPEPPALPEKAEYELLEWKEKYDEVCKEIENAEDEVKEMTIQVYEPAYNFNAFLISNHFFTAKNSNLLCKLLPLASIYVQCIYRIENFNVRLCLNSVNF